MTTINEEEFDYQAYAKTHPPDVTKIRRGPEARKQRFEAAKKRSAIRIDEDVLDQFQQLTPQAQDYERLINQALREWLSAQNIKELVREELHQMVQTVLTSIQPVKNMAQSKRNLVKR